MTTYRYTVAELRGQLLRQLVLSGAAIALGVVFLIASVSGSGALVDSYSQTAAAEVGPGDLQVTRPAADGGLDPATADRARQTPGVAGAALRQTGRGELLAADGQPLDDAATDTAARPASPDTRSSPSPTAGRRPAPSPPASAPSADPRCCSSSPRSP